MERDMSDTDEDANPAGIQGIEFVEYLSRQPDTLGQALERLGFRPIARHRSRAVRLYRQGTMNVIVNADADTLAEYPEIESDRIHAIALHVADAAQAYDHCIRQGARPVPTRAAAMELNIPGIGGIGDSVLYLVERRPSFSIYDVDFDYEVPFPDTPVLVPGLHFFGLVQYVDPGRTAYWAEFYARLLGCRVLPPGTRFGILPNGTILRGPGGRFHLQLVEPSGDALFDVKWDEQFARLAFGVPDVPRAVQTLATRAVPFDDNEFSHPDPHGAMTMGMSYDVNFELVHSDPAASGPGQAR
jgi:4-hydroxyphenylpyruvate dioxygenase